jgi:uncharacterized protein YbbK (DUF523 family)
VLVLRGLTKYNGSNNLNKDILQLVKEGKAIVVCPEQMGGCSTPRKPCEILSSTGKDVLDKKGKIINNAGEDVTDRFIAGAYETLKLANLFNIEAAIQKSKSPTCGCGEIYDGSFSGRLVKGNGVTAELLMQNGYKVISDIDWNESKKLRG